MLSATSSLAEPQEILNQTTQTFEDARAADPQVIAALGEKLQKLEQQRRKWTDDANEKIRGGSAG